MSVSKDAKTGTWIVYARYKNWQGKTEILHKRGFKTKREALEYEREFLLKKSKDLDMGFEKFVETYLRAILEILDGFYNNDEETEGENQDGK